MTALERATPAHVRPPLTAARAWWWRHPELPWILVVGASWVALTIWHYADHAVATQAQWRFDTASWSLMVLAMMLPAAVPMMRRLAFTSLWRRRHRVPALFAAAFVAGWIAIGVAAAAVVAAIEQVAAWRFEPGPGTVVTTLVIAALWQLAPSKRRSLRRTHLTLPIAPRGRNGDRSVIRYAWFHLRACFGSCGAIMAVMFVSHDFHIMAPLAAVSIVERFQTRPNERAGAAALVAVALLIVVS